MFCRSSYIFPMQLELAYPLSAIFNIKVQNKKPIFQRKLGSHKLPHVNEIDAINMKCTWPMQAPTQEDPMQSLSISSCWVCGWFALGLEGFLDAKMLVSAHVWGLEHRVGGLYQSVWGLDQRNARIRKFALQWNIGFSCFSP